MHREEIEKLYPQMSEADKKILFVASQWDKVDEIRQDFTEQRCFERGFLSIDVPDACGNVREYSYRKRDVGRLVRHVDKKAQARIRRLRHERRFLRAIRALNGHPELQATLKAIRAFRNKSKIIFALQIKGEVYEKRISRVREILKSRYVI